MEWRNPWLVNVLDLWTRCSGGHHFSFCVREYGAGASGSFRLEYLVVILGMALRLQCEMEWLGIYIAGIYYLRRGYDSIGDRVLSGSMAFNVAVGHTLWFIGVSRNNDISTV